VPPDPAADRWLLTLRERGNPHTALNRDADGAPWSAGNLVRPLVHGATYFARLYEELRELGAGDRICFTDWRGDADQKLRADGPTVREILCGLARRGVDIRGLLWRSHSDRLSFSAQQNQRLGTELNEAGGEALLDQRVRHFGSHHQKLFTIGHGDDSGRNVAFVGGIDLCHGRRDDATHTGDPQQQPMDERYGPRAPWHDAALELRGPVVADLVESFAERWDDPRPLDHRTPYRMAVQRMAHMPRHPKPLPQRLPPPPPAGPHAVQVLRTYGRHGYPFAPDGERSIARAYNKAFELATSLIYVEDQYLWSRPVAASLAKALARSPRLRVIAVVPRYPDADGRFTGPLNRIGQIEAMQVLDGFGSDRVAIYDLSNEQDVPIYVHAKICIVDDVWMTCGSDNFNRRSWSNDSEITCAVVDSEPDLREPRALDAFGDGARRLPRQLRLDLWSEHLAVPAEDPRLLDPVRGFDLWRERAAALDAWRVAGSRGPRPPGRARPHRPDPVSRGMRLVTGPVQRLVADPDGRRWRDRMANRF